VIEGLNPHWMWRTLLVAVGVASYFAAVIAVGKSFVQDLGIPRDDATRLNKLSLLPYISAIVIVGLAGLMNPISINLVWQSALPATAGAHSGLFWFRHYIPKAAKPEVPPAFVTRSYRWVVPAAVCGLLFIIVLGHGLTLTR
jgi:hypothetical protein